MKTSITFLLFVAILPQGVAAQEKSEKRNQHSAQAQSNANTISQDPPSESQATPDAPPDTTEMQESREHALPNEVSNQPDAESVPVGTSEAANKEQEQSETPVVKEVNGKEPRLVTHTKDENLSRLAITVSYFGEMIFHPGLTVGIEYLFYERKYFRALVEGNLGGYVHIQNRVALFLDVGMGFRLTSRRGFFFDSFLNIGYLHQWLASPVWERDSSGNIVEGTNPGSPHLAFSYSLGIGWDFHKNRRLPLSCFLGIKAFSEYPYNNYLIPRAVVQIGVIYRFKKRGQ